MSSGSPPKRRKWSNSVVVLFFVVLVGAPLAGPVFVVQIRKEIARWYWAAALHSRRDKRYDGSLEKFTQALKYEPGSPKLLIDRALLYIRMNRDSDAVADLDQLKGLTPRQTFLQARLYRRLKKPQKAADVLDSLSDLSNQHRLERAQIYLESERYDRAIADVDHIRKQPDTNKPLRDYLDRFKSNILFEQGKVNESLAILKRQLQEEEKKGGDQYASALNALAYQRSLAKVEIAAGIRDINKALKLANEASKSAFLDTRGWLYYQAKKYDLALADLDDAVKRFRKQYSAQLTRESSAQSVHRELAVMLKHRAFAYRALNQIANYESDIKEIIELGFDPTDKQLH